MSQFETFGAYIGRFITIEGAIYLAALLLIAHFLRNKLAAWLKISVARTFWIAIAFAGIVDLSLRFWDANGTNEFFWAADPMLWSGALRIGANWVLNAALYIPPAVLLVLARKSWWKVGLTLVALSAAIETIQQYTRIGAGDPADFVANATGAIIGLALGLLVLRLHPEWAAAK